MRKKYSHKFPIWLRRLELVKKELRTMQWPSEEDGFRQGLELLSFGQLLLRQEAPSAVKKGGFRLMNRWIEKQLSGFALADERWVRRWRKERGRYFSCPPTGDRREPLLGSFYCQALCSLQ